MKRFPMRPIKDWADQVMECLANQEVEIGELGKYNKIAPKNEDKLAQLIIFVRYVIV